MNYITTNIQLPKDDYLLLKAEAASKGKSLSALIGEKIGTTQHHKGYSKAEAEELLARTREVARRNAKYTKGFDSVKALREIRYAK